MVFLRSLLDDPAGVPCGRCDRCTGVLLDPTVPPALVAEAGAFLRSAKLTIDTRKQWIRGGSRTAIPTNRRTEVGRALCVLGDGGWGSVVGQARSAGEPYPDELVEAARKVIAGWQPLPAPTWVASVPSVSSPEVLPGFARRVAGGLGLPYVEVLRRARAGRPQAEMANSVQQLRNVEGAFEVSGPVPGGPVLLVDDLVDSGWTLTVAGAVLREAGAEAVHPLALAMSTGD
jgi:ATP-dependent DNA helicase RecQ